MIQRLDRNVWHIAGTSTSPDGASALTRDGIESYVFDGSTAVPGVAEAVGRASHILVSAPPGADGDPVLLNHSDDIRAAPHLEWIGYLSTIGVYGDRGGDWVDETFEAAPTSRRSRFRASAEAAWLELARHREAVRCRVFRLAGIYGRGRSAIDTVLSGRARRIVKPGQMFNRIHVEDIARIVEASMAGRGQEAIVNVTDNEPAPPQDVIAYAAELLQAPMPPEVAFEDADLSPMAQSFYAESKRVRNGRISADLGLDLLYPTYREGLAAIAADYAAVSPSLAGRT